MIHLRLIVFLIVSFNAIQVTDSYFHKSKHEKQILECASELFNYGNRLIILVAFDDTYTFVQFSSTLRAFANALSCPTRRQLNTFYFGDLSTQIDCEYEMNLVDCVNNRIFNNISEATIAYEVWAKIWVPNYVFLGIAIRKRRRQSTSIRRT